jgi:lipopolysaccharide transport system permease protein
VRYTIPFLTQLWLFATPVIYPSSGVHGPWRIILGLNPMTGVVEGFRWALLGIGAAPGAMIFTSMGVALLLVLTGLIYFNRMERTFADVV